MKTILITGGTGLVGRAITKHLLDKNYRVIILTRSLRGLENTDRLSYALWDIKKGTVDINALCSADGIIHLAGAGVVDKKWTAEYKKEILESRTKSAALLINTLKENIHRVKVFVSASATGWYGPDKIPGHAFTENEPADDDFPGEVCREWEAATEPAKALGIRVCRLRTGIVLDKEGGAYKAFRSPLKFDIAAILGNGKQTVSWIHVDDLCRAYLHALEEESMQGSYNAVAPVPVTNQHLVITIANAVRGKFYLPVHVPAFILKIMMGGRSIEILKSATVSAGKIQQSGFQFLYPQAEGAVSELESGS